MTLLKCGDCQNNYSDYASECPNCGRPTRTQKNRTERTFFGDFYKEEDGEYYQIKEKNKKYPKGPQVGDDLRYDLTLKSSEAIYGKQIKITIPKLVKCYECRGTGGKQGHLINCETCGGYGEVIRVTRTPFGKYNMRVECSECNGFGVKICKSCSGKGVKQTRKKLCINIPPEVKTGTKLKCSEEGNAGIKGGQPGDLYIFIRKLR